MELEATDSIDDYGGYEERDLGIIIGCENSGWKRERETDALESLRVHDRDCVRDFSFLPKLVVFFKAR